MQIRDLLIGLVLFSFIIIGMTTFLGELASNYNTQLEGNYTQTYSRINAISNTTAIAYDIQEKVEQGEGVSVVESLAVLSSAAFAALKIPFQAIGIIISILNEISKHLGLPSWFLTGFITIIVITITFMILSAILRKDI